MSAQESLIGLGSRPPETVLPDAPAVAIQRLTAALAQPAGRRRDAVADVVAAFPTFLLGWAELGALARDDLEAYACYRVGYHRGLDALRGAGWRGSGYVRWVHPANRGFLHCVEGLGHAAAAIGESAEEERCAVFLAQLDPAGRPADA
ncbi:MAG: DUF3151 family protein [Acidimicrobiales bacterium]